MLGSDVEDPTARLNALTQIQITALEGLDADMTDLDFLEKESGMDHQKQLEIQGQKINADILKSKGKRE